MSAYVVVFDDGRYLGHTGRPVFEYPEAYQFTSIRAAEKAARQVNLPSTVAKAEEYA